LGTCLLLPAEYAYWEQPVKPGALEKCMWDPRGKAGDLSTNLLLSFPSPTTFDSTPSTTMRSTHNSQSTLFSVSITGEVPHAKTSLMTSHL
jgi:hypothetical protein